MAFAAALVSVVVPAHAQYISVGNDLLQAVKQRDGAKATELLRSNGSSIINYRPDGGQPALHVLVGRRDLEWMHFLLSNGGDANLQNDRGDTAMLIAARGGWLDGINLLLRYRAKVDLANRTGETPLIVAVQQRQTAAVKRLLEAGASADKRENATGRSARDYAGEDRRSGEILRLIQTVKPAAARPAAGPSL